MSRQIADINIHRIKINKLGPIESVDIDLNEFNVFTGAQAEGKSTIAKAVYFCRTVKDEIYKIRKQQMEHPESSANSGIDFPLEFPINLTKKISFDQKLTNSLRDKFVSIFGVIRNFSKDMIIEYNYNTNKWIKISVQSDGDNNRLYFEYSDDIKELIEKYTNDNNIPDYSDDNLKVATSEINSTFNDYTTTIFIPAGRSMITLLTNQLAYMFTGMEDSQKRMIDYCTQSYIQLIMKLKPLFSMGINQMLSEQLDRVGHISNIDGLNRIIKVINKILKGEYISQDGEEIIKMSNGKDYVRVNYASSGQQDSLWILNIMFYYMLYGSPVFLILEEPESHLYPDTQKDVAEMLGLFCGEYDINNMNGMLVTTHSPYMLGAFNNLLLKGKIAEYGYQNKDSEDALNRKSTIAYYIKGGKTINAMNEEENLPLIKNELIDGASTSINDELDKLLEIKWSIEDKDEECK